MRIISWNVNSLRARLQRTVGLVQRHGPDVLCLQETKVEDARFPQMPFLAEGYHITPFGQGNYNGVAVLSRDKPDEVRRGFPGDPVPEQCRALWVRFGRLWIADLYVVNGKHVGHEAFDTKRRWLTALAAHVEDAFDPSDRLILVGDFNVAPEDRDVHDPKVWRERSLCSTAERERLSAVAAAGGLRDLQRLHDAGPGPWTWWDYRALGFPKDHGLRIDLALATEPVAAACTKVWVDREERKKGAWEEGPSDHAPLVVDLE